MLTCCEKFKVDAWHLPALGVLADAPPLPALGIQVDMAFPCPALQVLDSVPVLQSYSQLFLQRPEGLHLCHQAPTRPTEGLCIHLLPWARPPEVLYFRLWPRARVSEGLGLCLQTLPDSKRDLVLVIGHLRHVLALHQALSTHRALMVCFWNVPSHSLRLEFSHSLLLYLPTVNIFSTDNAPAPLCQSAISASSDHSAHLRMHLLLICNQASI